MDAEVNIDLDITFECPHCNATLRTRDYGYQSSIEVGVIEIECSSCGKKFDLNINESY